MVHVEDCESVDGFHVQRSYRSVDQMLQLCRDIIGNKSRPGLNEVLAHDDMKRGYKQPNSQRLRSARTGNKE